LPVEGETSRIETSAPPTELLLTMLMPLVGEDAVAGAKQAARGRVGREPGLPLRGGAAKL
jgi:hypothetical protein